MKLSVIENIVNKCKKDIEAIEAAGRKKDFYIRLNENEEITKRLEKKFAGVYKSNKLKYQYHTADYFRDISKLKKDHKKSLSEDINRTFDFLGNDQVKVKNDYYLWDISFMTEDILSYSEMNSIGRENIVKSWQNGKYILQLTAEQYNLLKSLA